MKTAALVVTLMSLCARHPQDARMYRHRGHRYISVREFGRAIEDLERALQLVGGEANQVEPDGLPNAQNIHAGHRE